MQTKSLPTVIAAFALLALAAVVQAAGDAEDVRALLKSYERVLNASDVAGVLELYADDGVFMAQHNPSAAGKGQIEVAYKAVFEAIELNVTFDIVEIEVIAPNWAFARTNSSGTTRINATGDQVSERNQELFLLERVNGDWKIARYAFSTTNPPR